MTLTILLMGVGAWHAAMLPGFPWPDRLPLQKSGKRIQPPRSAPKEVVGYDTQGNPVYIDPQPRIVPLGDGKYSLIWTGRRGREVNLIYQRPDVIEVVVEARLGSFEERQTTYVYKIRNNKSSKQNLAGFAVQTFSTNVQPYRNSVTHAGEMHGDAKEFRQGRWFRFAPFPHKKIVAPGQEVAFEMQSPDLPGIVECRAHGPIGLQGVVGEDIPEALIEVLPAHEIWPHGLTIGPDERLAKMGLQGRLNYLIIRLPQMLELGWIENEKVMQWYKENLKPAKAAEVRARAKSDFDNKLITSEVLALMTYLTQ